MGWQQGMPANGRSSQVFTKNAMPEFWLTILCIIEDDALPAREVAVFLGRCTLCLTARIFDILHLTTSTHFTASTPSHTSTRTKRKRKIDDPTINPRQSTDTHRESSVP